MLIRRQSVCRRPAESHDRAGVYRESRVARRLAQCANSGSGRRGTTVRFGSTDGGDTTATTAEGRVLRGLRAGARDGDTPVRQSDNRHRRVEASLHARAHAGSRAVEIVSNRRRRGRAVWRRVASSAVGCCRRSSRLASGKPSDNIRHSGVYSRRRCRENHKAAGREGVTRRARFRILSPADVWVSNRQTSGAVGCDVIGANSWATTRTAVRGGSTESFLTESRAGHLCLRQAKTTPAGASGVCPKTVRHTSESHRNHREERRSHRKNPKERNSDRQPTTRGTATDGRKRRKDRNLNHTAPAWQSPGDDTDGQSGDGGDRDETTGDATTGRSSEKGEQRGGQQPAAVSSLRRRYISK